MEERKKRGMAGGGEGEEKKDDRRKGVECEDFGAGRIEMRREKSDEE